MEVWRWIEGYEGHYAVSNLGKVASHKFKKVRILEQGKDTHGYCIVSLIKSGVKKTHAVHRLVCNAFLPKSENTLQVNHINGIKSDNRLENLERITAKENTQHAHKTGLVKSGLEHHKADKKQYSFVHPVHGVVVCTQYELIKDYKASRCNLSSLINGTRKTVSGWRLNEV